MGAKASAWVISSSVSLASSNRAIKVTTSTARPCAGVKMDSKVTKRWPCRRRTIWLMYSRTDSASREMWWCCTSSHAFLVVPVDFDARILVTGVGTVEVRARGRDRRNEREKRAHGGVERPEFLIARKGEVQVRRLQICPAVPFAVEDPVVSVVDLRAFVRPQVRFRERVHEGMACGGEEHRPDLRELPVCEENLLVEDISPALERGDGFRAFEFQNVRDKFI